MTPTFCLFLMTQSQGMKRVTNEVTMIDGSNVSYKSKQMFSRFSIPRISFIFFLLRNLVKKRPDILRRHVIKQQKEVMEYSAL